MIIDIVLSDRWADGVGKENVIVERLMRKRTAHSRPKFLFDTVELWGRAGRAGCGSRIRPYLAFSVHPVHRIPLLDLPFVVRSLGPSVGPRLGYHLFAHHLLLRLVRHTHSAHHGRLPLLHQKGQLIDQYINLVRSVDISNRSILMFLLTGLGRCRSDDIGTGGQRCWWLLFKRQIDAQQPAADCLRKKEKKTRN